MLDRVVEGALELLCWWAGWRALDYLIDKIPVVYRMRNRVAARRLSKARRTRIVWKPGKEPITIVVPESTDTQA